MRQGDRCASSKMARDAAVIARAAQSFRISGSSRLGDRPFRPPAQSLNVSDPGGLADRASTLAPSPIPFATAGFSTSRLLPAKPSESHLWLSAQVHAPRPFLTRNFGRTAAVSTPWDCLIRQKPWLLLPRPRPQVRRFLNRHPSSLPIAEVLTDLSFEPILPFLCPA